MILFKVYVLIKVYALMKILPSDSWVICAVFMISVCFTEKSECFSRHYKQALQFGNCIFLALAFVIII